MTLHERVLSVLAYRPVSEVVMGAPHEVSKDLMECFNIHVVVQGRTSVTESKSLAKDPFAVPKQMGLYKLIDSGNEMTTSMIIERIINNRLQFESRNTEKETKERAAFVAVQALKNAAGGGSGTTAVVSINAKDVLAKASECHNNGESSKMETST